MVEQNDEIICLTMYDHNLNIILNIIILRHQSVWKVSLLIAVFSDI